MIALGRKWLKDVFKSKTHDAATRFTSPEDVIYPVNSGIITDHIRFLLHAKEYIASHPVPDDRMDALNQYSHAGKPLIGNDRTKPAITNCSYEFYGRKLISIGYPLFVRDAPIVKDNAFNPAFNNGTLWDSFQKVLEHYIGDVGTGDTKYGYSLPTHHAYIEKPVTDAVFEKTQKIIEFYTRTNISEPHLFMSALDNIIHIPSASVTPPSL